MSAVECPSKTCETFSASDFNPRFSTKTQDDGACIAEHCLARGRHPGTARRAHRTARRHHLVHRSFGSVLTFIARPPRALIRYGWTSTACYSSIADNSNSPRAVPGPAASGKSTLACALELELLQRKKRAFRLDGDNVRFGLNKDLGFSPKDREENIRRVGEVRQLSLFFPEMS